MTTLPILLPPGFIILVKPHDTVVPGDILAKAEVTGEIAFSIPQILQTTIKKSATLLRKNPGDRIRKGDILASKKGAFGFSTDVVTSEIEGTFMRYDRATGTIVVQPDSTVSLQEKGEIVCPIDGVVEVCDNDKILLATDKDVIQANAGVGGETRGKIIAVTDAVEHVQLHHLGATAIGNIILGGNFDRDTLLKAIGMGAAGIIASSIREEDLEHVMKRNLTTPVVTVDSEWYTVLQKWNGKHIYLQGAQKTVLLLHL